jgi:type I restriction enzyme S subunit
MTEHPLPAGWAETTLGELATLVRNGIFASRPAEKPPGYPILRISSVRPSGLDLDDRRYVPDVDPERVPTYALNENDLLFTRYNGSRHLVGVCARVPRHAGPLLHPDKLIRVVVPPEVADARYLAHYLNSRWVRDHLEPRIRTTAGQSGIAGDAVRSIPIRLPPLAEQRRIADEVDAVMSRLSKAERMVDVLNKRLSVLREDVLRRAASGRLVPQRPSDTPAGRALKGALGDVPEPPGGELADLPASWACVQLSSIADVVGGVTKDMKKQDEAGLVEAPYLRVANVQRGALKLDQVARIKVTPAKLAALRLRAGDVLMNEGGDRDKLGRGWIWEDQIDDCVHQNHVFRARIHKNVLHPKLLSWHGNTFGQRWFEAVGKQTTNLASISLTNLRRLPVPVPPPEEQVRIVAEVERQLSILDSVAEGLTRVQGRCEALRRSVLRQAYTGRLVEANSVDEPAELMLRRLLTDRQHAEPTAAQRRQRTVGRPRRSTAVNKIEETA